MTLCLKFLESRGYTPSLIEQDGPLDRSSGGSIVWEGLSTSEARPYVAWCVSSMSGAPVGIQTRLLEEKNYRWYQCPQAAHLPMVYGSQDDWEKLWATEEVILTEGIFDRVAVKRALPDRAVLARLSKGAANQMGVFLRRYSKRVYLLFDNDEPGQQAVETTRRSLQDYLQIETLNIPFNDPSLVLEKRGEKRFREILERQITALEF